MATDTDHKPVNQGPISEIDLDKLWTVFRSSLVWILAIILISNSGSYLFLRWTKPLYESQSELKLDVKSEASILNLNTYSEAQNLNNISGEIELIQSRLFFNQVIESFDIKVGYYVQGNILIDERYKQSPFIVDYEIKNPQAFDQKFFVEFVDEFSFQLSYTLGGFEVNERYNFGETIETEDFVFLVRKRRGIEDSSDGINYYFIVHSDEALLDYLGSNLRVEPLNLPANIIRISFTDYNPFKARDLVNVIDSLYLDYTRQEKNKANKQKIDFLDEQLSVTEDKLKEYESYFENFTIENKTANLDNDLKETIRQINLLDSQRFQLRNRKLLLSELVKDIVNEEITFVPLAFRSTISTQLSAELDKLNQMLAEKEILLATQKENTFAVQRKLQEIDRLRSTVAAQLTAVVNQIDADLSGLAARKSTLEQSFVQLPSKSNDFTKTKRYYDLYEEFYLSLMQNKAEFQIAQAGTTTDFKILSAATLPKSPIYPQQALIYGIGATFGLLISLLFVTGRYVLHNKVTSSKEIERYSKISLMGSIPFYSGEKMPITKLLVDRKPKSAVSEAMRAIRTNIEFLVIGQKNKVISVTSTVSGEGKTFVSVNLGGIIAMSNSKVVILDLDMRKPRIHVAFSGEEQNKGVSTILIKKNNIQECIQKTSIPNLDYIPAGPTPPNPSELLLEPAFDELLEELKTKYDIVLLDTPPVGLVTDAILAMKKADLAIYVLRSDYSRISYLETANRLASVNKFSNLALVLNSLRSANAGYGYGYGYGYYEEDKG